MSQNNLTDQFLAGDHAKGIRNLLQKKILDLCHASIPFDLRDLQLEAILYFLRKEKNIFFVVPTGYGKTIVAILSALYIWNTQKKKTIMIGLYKSLTQEQFDTFSQYCPTLIDDGDHQDSKNQWDQLDWMIGCFTPERFDSILSDQTKRESLMADVGLIVSDEIQNLADEGRGHRMENYLMICRYLFDLRYVFLSATIGNPEFLSDALDCQLIQGRAMDRPVPLMIEYYPYKEITYEWNENIPDYEANFNLRITMLKAILRTDKDSTFLIFVTSRPRTKQIARILCPSREHLELMDMAEGYGIAYHSAELSKEDRNYVESGFRSGDIKIIVCTPTLAAGVNLPADHVILFDIEEFNMLQGKDIIGANRIQQSIGRAGRPGLSEKGYAHVIYPDRIEDEVKYRVTHPSLITSQIKPRIHEKILQWIGGDVISNIDDAVLISSYSINPISHETIENGMRYLSTFQFINIISSMSHDIFSASDLGIATNQMYLMPETVVYWIGQTINLIAENPDFTDSKQIMQHLFIRFGSTHQYMDIIRVTKDDAKLLSFAIKEIGEKFPIMDAIDYFQCLYCQKNVQCSDIQWQKDHCEKRHLIDVKLIPEQILKAYFLTFYDELKEKYLPKKANKEGDLEVKELSGFSAGDKNRLKEVGGRIFKAAAYILQHCQFLESLPSNNPDLLTQLTDHLNTLSKLCEVGVLNPSLVELMDLQKIGYARAKLLVDNGIHTKEAFLTKDPHDLVSILHLSPAVIKQIQELNNE